MRKLIVLAAAMLMSGCSLNKIFEPSPQMLVYLGCQGSWAEIRDARNNVLIPFIRAGDTKPLPITAHVGDNMELTAKLFSLADSHPLGAATTSVNVPSQTFCGPNGCYTQKDYSAQQRTWEINSLSSRVDRNYSCY